MIAESRARMERIAQRILSERGLGPSRYAANQPKSSPGQKSLFDQPKNSRAAKWTQEDEDLHPRAEDGTWAEKDAGTHYSHHHDDEPTAAEKKDYADYKEFVTNFGQKAQSLDDWLHHHRTGKALAKHREESEKEKEPLIEDEGGESKGTDWDKKPWELTQKDYGQQQLRTTKAGILDDAELAKLDESAHLELYDEWHREEVEKAIEEGESVPSEVLSDYPDLVKGAIADDDTEPDEDANVRGAEGDNGGEGPEADGDALVDGASEGSEGAKAPSEEEETGTGESSADASEQAGDLDRMTQAEVEEMEKLAPAYDALFDAHRKAKYGSVEKSSILASNDRFRMEVERYASGNTDFARDLYSAFADRCTVDLYRKKGDTQTTLWTDEDEEKHPRDDSGQWTSAEKHTKTVETKKGPVERHEWKLPGGKALPQHVTEKPPPSWTDVKISSDPKHRYQFQGRDEKGRLQQRRAAWFVQQQDAKKWKRVKGLRVEIRDMLTRNKAEWRNSPDESDCFSLIATMGLRPGSEVDTGAEHQSYGATTLEGRHVVVGDDGQVSLKFVPAKKHGEEISLPVVHDSIASMLLRRKESAGDDGRLFDTTPEKLRKHVKQLGKSDFKAKDLRTFVGTETAKSMVSDIVGSGSKPADMKGLRKAQKTISTAVSDILGNTPKVAFDSYIDPDVWAPLITDEMKSE